MLNSFTSYVSFFEAGEDMTDEEYGQYMRAIHNFAYKDIEPDYSKLSPLVKAALRTVIASVRKNKEDRINGKSGGRPSKEEKGVSEKEKGGLFEKEKGGYFFSETNVKENVNVKENEKEKGKGEEEPFPAQNAPAPSDFSTLQKSLFKKITEHNASVPVESRIPISSNEISFVQKECRELIDVMQGSPPAEILHTVENLLKSAREKRKKRYNWYWFLKDINDYKPGFFVDSTASPEELDANGFYQRMKDNPRFKTALFCVHQNDWINAGKPCGDEYFKLQNAWEGINAS